MREEGPLWGLWVVLLLIVAVLLYFLVQANR